MPRLGDVKLFKQIKIDGSWKLAPALYDSKGRVRRDHVRVQGRDEQHAEGTYYLEYWTAGKRTREPAGADAFMAAEAAKRKQAERGAIRSGIVPAPANDNGESASRSRRRSRSMRTISVSTGPCARSAPTVRSCARSATTAPRPMSPT